MTRINSQQSPTSFDGSQLRVGVVCGRFNDHITTALLDGARRGLERCQVSSDAIDVVWVPGAFEAPLAAITMARTGDYDAVITLGAVIRGDTAHFDFVAGECARGIQNAQLETGVPIMFGVLTVDTNQQAIDRSGPGHDNKGDEAAVGAVEMALLVQQFTTSTD
ncbi:MAG: 6,7-dimethyl-8-ribityllumazine synthase [Actinomycetota bacterium]|nr:6,7-dimethyl-8-ribityllumazine synthase [Actinomycetota bacterium]MDA3001788.1 6,7-dimethyl-8-ribityllumazine synthase [Actinomycetota bacterium]